MTFDRPKGGFSVSEISHVGIVARCCYDSAEFELEEKMQCNGAPYFLHIIGKLDGEDEKMKMLNGFRVSMTEGQVEELIDYLKKKMGVDE